MSVETPRSVLQYVGGWKLGSTLGRGGFGHVRKAKHLGTNRVTACKILPAVDPSSPLTKDMIMDAMEAQKEEILLKLMAGLNIEGVVGIDMVRHEKQWKYLFLPMLPQSASSIRAPVPAERIIPFFRQLLRSLHSLHSIGVWHEDLKPANILMTETGMPVLADFGLTTFSPRLKRACSGGGTLDYMSPEKIENRPYDGAASDVYACGILLYKWLTNHHPFIRDRTDDTDEVIENRILKGEIEFRMTREPGSAGELIWKMLRGDPLRRYTIPKVLAHPFLNPPNLRPETPWKRPVLDHTPIPEPSPKIVFEVTFLAYISNLWYPCQTDQCIRENLASPFPAWEKTMYHAISAWKAKDPDADKDMTSKPMMKALLRVMSEASISDNQPQNTGQPGAPAGRIVSPEKKATAPLNVRPASPQKKLDFPLIPQNARANKIKPETNKENAVIALPVATLGLTEKPVGTAVQMGVVQGKQKVMQDKTGNEVNKQNDRVVAAMARVKQVQAEMAKKEESEVIDLLSDTDDQEVDPSPPVKAVELNVKTKTKVTKTKPVQARGKKAPKIKLNDDELQDPDEEENQDTIYLPAPLPKQRHAPRRSPRLQGIAPENIGLDFEPRARRTRMVV
ncbi:kinase-like domain-containing protein [Filobasidium floriforme]|uniref:kinase-like domain-containing protein n=1 Tax=Filobasidium floriforme TaxID=5210 RepID=UPI001E8E17FC|nr:kinase-like domain-containing protein [Filobasidium floriforme]KAH8079670.1 kinase-like domain-containing protein [Filobasidium floriforme]